MHLAIDMDDVVLAFVDNLVKTLNTEYDAGLTVDDIVEWDLAKTLDPFLGHEGWWEWWSRRDWLWAQAAAVPGAIGTMEQLRADGHFLELVTVKPRWAEPQTWRWLGKWRPPVNLVRIVELKEGEHLKKVDLTQADLVIDDKPSTCEEFADAGRLALLFERPHNLAYLKARSWAVARDHGDGVPLHGQVTRVKNWKQVKEAIDAVEAQA